jgi:hypothetical protein
MGALDSPVDLTFAFNDCHVITYARTQPADNHLVLPPLTTNDIDISFNYLTAIAANDNAISVSPTFNVPLVILCSTMSLFISLFISHHAT